MMGQYRTEYTKGREFIKFESNYTRLIFSSKLKQRRRKLDKILEKNKK